MEWGGWEEEPQPSLCSSPADTHTGTTHTRMHTHTSTLTCTHHHHHTTNTNTTAPVLRRGKLKLMSCSGGCARRQGDREASRVVPSVGSATHPAGSVTPAAWTLGRTPSWAPLPASFRRSLKDSQQEAIKLMSILVVLD